SRGADADAVAAVDAGGVGERHVVLGGDASVEASPGQGDGEGVLRVGAAGLDALVANDALGVIADVEIIVHFHRLPHRGGATVVRRMVMAGSRGIALTFAGGRRR